MEIIHKKCVKQMDRDHLRAIKNENMLLKERKQEMRIRV